MLGREFKRQLNPYDIQQSDLPLSGAGETLRNNIMATLLKYYPSMSPGWDVVVDERGGIVQLRNLRLSGRMGCILKITRIDPEMRSIIRNGGELLERYRIARSRYVSPEKTVEIERDFRGEAKFDK